jgi:predicted nuclease of predicted toxin-antitoxin system
MKVLIDENLSVTLSDTCNAHFSGSQHVSKLDLLKADDKQIWNFARQNDYVILTKDWDFYYMSSSLGCPPKVIRLSCGNKTTSFLQKRIISQLRNINSFLRNPDLCYMEIE